MDARLKLGLMWLSGALAGGSATYLVTRRYLDEKYETILDVEIASIKNHYEKKAEQDEKVGKTGRFKDPVQAFGTLHPEYAEKLEEMGYEPAHVQEGLAQDAQRMDIVDEEYPTEEYPDISERVISTDEPYVITWDEYNEDHNEYEKLTFTYYEEDEILADDGEQPVPDPDSLIGDDTLDRFGQWSRDPNIVYARNDRIATDFEIVRNKGSYAEVVHGLDVSEHKVVRKMRNGD